jgi:hypothetical protein
MNLILVLLFALLSAAISIWLTLPLAATRMEEEAGYS